MSVKSLPARAGFTLIEVCVAVVILGAAFVGVAVSGVRASVVSRRAQEEVQYWGDAQQVIDSLFGRGFGNVASGSRTVRGRVITWTAGASVNAPQSLTVVVNRPTYTPGASTVADTVVLYLNKTAAGA